MKTTAAIAVAVVSLSCLSACRGEPLPAADPTLTSGAGDVKPPGWPTLGTGVARFIRIDLGPDVFAECQKVSPKFPFDSATTYAQDRMQLGALAACLNAPGMRERTLLLVGRADPHGTDAYNDRLGTKRAEAIKAILVESGIAESRIEVASEGEKGARSGDPSWSAGSDRRVDVIVRGGSHTP